MKFDSRQYLRLLASKIHAIVSLIRTHDPDVVNIIKRFVRYHASHDPATRYAYRHQFLDSVAQRWGFQVYNKHLIWLDDENFWSVWRNFPDWRKERPDRKFVVWTIAQQSCQVDGDSAECGVLSGASSFLICTARQHLPNSPHHVFDSFEGMSLPDDKDKPMRPGIPEWRHHDLVSPEDVAQKNLRAFPFVRYYKGWIPTRFQEVANVTFSFIHIDVDLYQPTADSLHFFYPRLANQGMILCDDYGYHTCAGALRALNEFAADRPNEFFMIHLPTGQCLLVKRKLNRRPA